MTTLSKVKKTALALTMAERILLVQDIWDSIADEPNELKIPKWHQELIDQRLSDHKREPSRVASWADVKRRVQRKLARKRKG